MKRTLACVLALAVTAVGVSFTLIPAAYAYQPEPPAGTAVTRTVAPEDHMVRVHANLATLVRTWTVASGQTLSSIAAARYGSQDAWTVIYWANHRHIKWANQIQVGQTFNLPDYIGNPPAAPKLLEPPPPPPPVVVATSSSSSSTSGYHPVYRHHHTVYRRTYSAPSSTYHGGGGMESCIIARESGGNSQVMNSSGHYGLYQFSASTWAASGGSSSSFGHASVAEQQRVFHTAVAARGYSDWSPYDGC